MNGPDGNVWFTDGDADAIGRITSAGTVTEFSDGLTGGESHGITAGPDGNVWFTEGLTSGRIGRITPAGVISEFSSGLATGSVPSAITSAKDGNLYFTGGRRTARRPRVGLGPSRSGCLDCASASASARSRST